MVDGGRRDHDVDPAPVDQAAVHHRRRSIHSQAERRNDTLDRGVEIRFSGESCLHTCQLATPVHPDVIRPVDQDVGHRRVREQWLEWPETQDPIGDDPGPLCGATGRGDREQAFRFSAHFGPAQRNRSRRDVSDDPVDHAHGISQTLSQARTQRA